MKVKPYVKTSLAPGSRVVTDYLDKAGLTESLNALGFHTVGYGCTTCIGNSGPLPEEVSATIRDNNLVVCSVLSGNRNFEGRVNPLVKANYLASPPLVVAYALAGTTDIDLTNEPLGEGPDGKDGLPEGHLAHPGGDSRSQSMRCVQPEMFARSSIGRRIRFERKVERQSTFPRGELYAWDAASTYIQEPPFLVDLTEIAPIRANPGTRGCLALLGDSVTTDHISPAGSIAKDGPAGRYLMEHGVPALEFNSFGSRRGNDRVMTRGTFANIRIRNQLAPGTEGGVTRHLPDGEAMSVYDAAMKYKADGVPLIVLAGAEYGTGSSRDWAAKGTMLLGVKAVIAASYERIHRSNLVGMGVLPWSSPDGTTWQSLGLTGEETFDIGRIASPSMHVDGHRHLGRWHSKVV